MKADYLDLTDGRRVRVAWNMNALAEFVQLTGKDLSDLSGKNVDIGILRTIAWLSAREGEEIEGRVLELNEKEFGRLLDMSGVVAFGHILAKQTAGISAEKKNRRFNWMTR